MKNTVNYSSIRRIANLANLVPLCPLLFTTACSDENITVINFDYENLSPKTNADGNYNIIFITADQEHFMSEYPLGSNYQARERLRRLGISFEKHYACSNVSTPSRSVIYTGMHVPQTGMLDNTNYPFQACLDTTITTIGDRMRQSGFYTAYKGKWHLGTPDAESNEGGDFSNSLEPYGFSDWNAGGDPYGSTLEGYGEDKNIANEACEWIEKKGIPLNNEGRSFFLAVNFVNPHDIMYFNSDEPGEEIQNKPDISDNIRYPLMEIVRAPNDILYSKQYPSVPIPSTWNEPIDKDGRPSAHLEYYKNWNLMVGNVPSEEDNWERFRDYYYNCIQDSDNQLLRLLDLLEEKDMLNKTIIVLTADHGEMLGAHGLRGKGGNMYENNIHVPLIVYHPELKGNRRCRNISSHIDLAPTLVDLTSSSSKQKMIDEMKGHSLLPMIINPSKNERSEGALFVYDMISMMDGLPIGFVRENGEISGLGYRVNVNKRGYLRGIITEQYKFARYFSPVAFNTPVTLEELYNNNDVELYSTSIWGDETENLGYKMGMNDDKVIKANTALNTLITKEIGVDDGRETDGFKGGGIWAWAKDISK